LLIDGSPAGSATAAGAITAVITSGIPPLTDGTHTITAVQTAPSQLVSNASAPLSITVDTTSPTVSPVTFTYDTTQSLTYSFSEPLTSNFSSSSVTVTNLNTASAVNTAASFDASTNKLTFTFPDGILSSANYQATLSAASIKDLAGNSLTGNGAESFFFQMADANRDRTVNALDFSILASNFGISGGTSSQGNFNYDGVVDTSDFVTLATNFGDTLAPPAAPLVSVAPLTAPQAAAMPALFGSHRIAGDDGIQSLLA
jgi:hypothetical protein